MKKKRHTPEQIVKKLHTASEDLARGSSVDAVCRKLAIIVATYHRWSKEYADSTIGTVKRLKELEKENARLKKIVAEQA